MLKSIIFAALFAVSSQLGAAVQDEWNRLVKIAVQAQKKGDNKAAERSLLKALLVAEGFAADDPRAAYTLDYLGTLYQQRGDSSEALAVFERARQGFVKSLGPDSAEAVDSGQRLGDAYAAAGLWAKAEPYYRERLDRERARAPQDPLALAAAATDLGLALDSQEQWDAALKLYKEAEDLRRKALGPESAELAESLNNQGRLHLMRGDLKKAEKLIRQALAIDEKALGEGDPAVADDLRRLAAVLYRAGKHDESAQLGARAERLDADRAPAPKPRRLAGPPQE